MTTHVPRKTYPSSMKIFGREPAAMIGALQALLLLAGALLHWTGNEIGALGLVLVLLGDGYVAWVTHETLYGVVVGLIKAVVAATAAFGLDLDPGIVAAATGLVTGALGLFQRTQTFPVYDPLRPLPGAIAVSEVGTA